MEPDGTVKQSACNALSLHLSRRYAMYKKLLMVAAVALLPATAIAQVPQDGTRSKELSVAGPSSAPARSVGTSARDGCVNQPGIPHNSADCSRIPASDYNTAQNTFSTDVAGRPTGATENAERNARIMNGVSPN
jgi:hypothetical protein